MYYFRSKMGLATDLKGTNQRYNISHEREELYENKNCDPDRAIHIINRLRNVWRL